MRIGSQIELNLFDSDRSLAEFADLAIKNSVQAVVMDPKFITTAVMDRSTRIAFQPEGYKIIAALDFPHGRLFSMDKFKSCPREHIEADGFEVVLSSGPDSHIHNEMKALFEWIKMIKYTAEVRWVIPVGFKEDQIKSVLKHSMKFKPDFIRIDARLSHNEALDLNILDLFKGYKGKLKLSGNNNIETIVKLRNKISRFDMTVSQAKAAIATAASVKDWDALKKKIEDEKKATDEKAAAKAEAKSKDNPEGIGYEVGDDGEWE